MVLAAPVFLDPAVIPRLRRSLWPALLITLLAGGLARAQAADAPSDQQARLLKQSVVAFNAAAFAVRETGEVLPPHIEVLFEVPTRGERLHAHHLPGWLRVSLDRLPPVEHLYTDSEWHALVDGALQVLLTAPFSPGSHTLAVTFKGIDRNGKPYLRTKSFSLESPRSTEHYVIRFHAAPGEEPSLSLDSLGESLLRPRPGTAAGSLAYRIGRFDAASGNPHGAAGVLLAALQNGLAGEYRSDAQLLLAEAYGTLGAPEEAEALLERLASETSDASLRARAWFFIERIAYQDGRHDRVIQAYARIGSALPSDLVGEARTLAGLSALALRSFAQAEELFRAVPKSSADAPLATFGLAQALAGQGDAFTAITSFTKLTQSRSLFTTAVQSGVSSYAHAALGFQLLEQARYREAVEELAQVPSDHPMSHASLFAIGWCLSKSGEHVKAIAVFDDLLTRAPDGQYAHEARLAAAASYADLRAPTRSVAAYRTALDALGESAAELDRLRAVVRGPTWDPLSDYEADFPASARRLVRETPQVALALTRYRWLVQIERDLRRTIADFPGFLKIPSSNTLGGRLNTKDGSHLVAQGQELLTRIEVVNRESRKTLAALILDAVDRERNRVEDWSVAASLGIARNLRDDIGREGLSLE
ncbi:MAG: tetratricopeptide repeat protein [Nitrospirota bacterium]